MKTSESKEDIKKQNVPSNLDIKEKVIIDKFKKKNKKLCLIKLFSISFMILIVTFTLLVVYFVFKNKSNKPKEELEETKTESENIENIKEREKIEHNHLPMLEINNSIIGVYSLEKGKETNIFNPEKINLNEKDYNIEIIIKNTDENNNSSNVKRVLQEINSKFIPELSGKYEIRISFNILLTSMFELFKNCKI